MTLWSHVARATRQLEQAGIAPTEATLDAELLARHVLQWDRAAWLLRRLETAPPGFASRYQPLLDRRAAREPIAYIRGAHEFWGREFAVAPGVLIPRPETELLIEDALRLVDPHADARILDIGTGSGCIAITLGLERPRAHVCATDISERAVTVARANAARWEVTNVCVEHGALAASCPGGADLIVSNPPYIAERDRPSLAPEVLHEPGAALFAGDDGLRVVREIVGLSARALAIGGHLLCEIGFGQHDGVRGMIDRTAGLTLLGIRPDLQGIPRVVIARRVSGAE